MTLNKITSTIEATQPKSAWNKGVKTYALELIETLADNNGKDFDFVGSKADHKELLNGAQDWKQYSEGGCSLCYNIDIANRLCTPSELKRSHNGQNDPNPRENWIDCQSRALYQAEQLILSLI